MPPKKKSNNVEEINTFTLAFMGEYINVVTDLMIVDFSETESQSMEQNAPMVTRGYLLDEDDKYLYLGENSFEICQAVAKSKIALLQVEKKKTKYDEILDEMGDASKTEDFN